MERHVIVLYGIVVLTSFAFVLLELLKTFGTDTLGAFRNRWTWGLISINIVVAVAVYALATSFTKTSDSVIMALVIGLSYPVLLRSRFTYFREVGPQDKSDLTVLSLKVDEAYTLLQSHCWRAVDDTLAAAQFTKTLELTQKYKEDQLKEAMNRLIIYRKVEENREHARKELETILSIPNEEMRKQRLAYYLANLPPKVLKRLLQQT